MGNGNGNESAREGTALRPERVRLQRKRFASALRRRPHARRGGPRARAGSLAFHVFRKSSRGAFSVFADCLGERSRG
eukprot:1056571-Prorocentrum_minimum.AAC.3